MVTHSRDHQIVINSTTRSLDLMRDGNGKALYSVLEEVTPHLSNILFSQSDWVGGHGQYGMDNPTMYFSGQSIDTTQEGRVLLGPLIDEVYSAATKKQNYITGADANAATYGQYWNAQTFTPSDNHTVGLVKLLLYRVGNPGIITVSIQATTAGKPSGVALCSGTYDGNTITTNTAGEWITFSLGAGTALTSGTVYAILFAIPGNSSANRIDWKTDITTPGYTDGSLVYSVNSGATWAIDTSIDCLFEEWSTGSTELDTTPIKFLWSATLSKLFCATAGKIYSYNGTGWTDEETLSGVTDIVEYNGILFAALGTGTAYYYSTDGSTWTVSTLTDHHATAFLSAPSADGLSNVLWKALAPNQIASNTSGTDAGAVQWTSPAYIGDTTNNITNIFLNGESLMIGRADNLYRYDSDGSTHALMEDLKVSRTAQNFKYVCYWQGNTYFSAGTGLYEMTAYNTVTRMGPLQDTTDIDKIGTVVGLDSDIDYLYVAMLEGTVTHIYKGKRTGTVWSWCPLVYLGTNTCYTIGIAQHSLTDKRLWFGYGTHTGYVYISDNPTTDDNARFCASGLLRMSYLYGTNPYYDKMIQSTVTETAGCTVTTTVTPKYWRNTDTSATGLTAAITTNGVVKTNLTTALSGNRFQFEVDLATNDSTITPQVRKFEVHGFEKPECHRIHDCTYLVGTDPSNKASTIMTFLRSGRTSTALIKFADLRFGEYTTGTAGTNYQYVIMEPGSPTEIELYNEKTKSTEMGIKCTFREVNYT